MKSPEPQPAETISNREGPSAPGAVSVSEGSLDQRLQTEIDKADDENGDFVKKVASVVLGIVHEESFSGPLPHPKHLAEYDRVLPGAADRIIAMAEKEQTHRHDWENTSLKFDFSYSILGIVLGFLIALALLVLAYISSQAGHQNVALAFLAASTVGMVASFIKGRSWLEDEKSEPEKDPTTPKKNRR